MSTLEETTHTIITLDVGGKIFKSKKNLLISKSKYFEDLFSDNKINENEIIFIDRSPHLFKHVLSKIRNDNYVCTDFEDKLLKDEYDYFGINNNLTNKLYAVYETLLIMSGKFSLEGNYLIINDKTLIYKEDIKNITSKYSYGYSNINIILNNSIHIYIPIIIFDVLQLKCHSNDTKAIQVMYAFARLLKR